MQNDTRKFPTWKKVVLEASSGDEMLNFLPMRSTKTVPLLYCTRIKENLALVGRQLATLGRSNTWCWLVPRGF